MPDGRKRIAVALDLASREEFLSAARLLQAEVGTFKIGLEAFTSHGPELVRELVSMGAPVFLDLKLHDIPNTVGGAASAAARTGAARSTAPLPLKALLRAPIVDAMALGALIDGAREVRRCCGHAGPVAAQGGDCPGTAKLALLVYYKIYPIQSCQCSICWVLTGPYACWRPHGGQRASPRPPSCTARSKVLHTLQEHRCPCLCLRRPSMPPVAAVLARQAAHLFGTLAP